MTVVVTAALLGLYFTVRAKLDSIHHIAMADTHHRPPSYNNALNILLLGSDSRSGHNAAIAGKSAATAPTRSWSLTSRLGGTGSRC